MFADNIKRLAKENTNFRKVLYTGSNSQLVVMNIPVGLDIGREIHPSTDQIIFVTEGEGVAILDGDTKQIKEHDVIFVPAGVMHNFRNVGDEDLKLFTVYAPPEHQDGTIHKTKGEASKKENSGGGE
jgi:mannose-6-phosphate isomerase-like protein (cupin superfamily)